MTTVQEKQQSDNVVENTPVLFAERKGELLMKIYDTLRKEIEEWIREISVLIVYATLATGVVWGWVLSEEQKLEALVEKDSLLRFLLFVPAALSVLFALRSRGIRKMIQTASTHLAKIEKTCGLDEILGWDIYWFKIHKSQEKPKPDSPFGWPIWLIQCCTGFFATDLDGFLRLFWIGIILVNVAAGYLVFLTV
jgi:hypothetical protein